MYINLTVDGSVDCRLRGLMQVGTVQNMPVATPVIKMMLIAGDQQHPIWTINDAAIRSYAFIQAAREMGFERLQATVQGWLVSDDQKSFVVATQVFWHVGAELRLRAGKLEQKIFRSPWPERNPIPLPISQASFLAAASREMQGGQP
jgi:hypothetical protein